MALMIKAAKEIKNNKIKLYYRQEWQTKRLIHINLLFNNKK